MKFVKREEAEEIVNGKTSCLLEYSKKLGDKDLDFCINTISGRYPKAGYCSNLQCKEMAYILEETGAIHKKDKTVNFKQGDVILIEKEEVYFWEGNCRIIMVCSPAWYKEQCKIILQNN